MRKYAMAGPNVRTPPLQAGNSTPSDQGDGIVAGTPFADLAKYEINTRAFHPNKNFEPTGFRFKGDNRGFSLGESWFDRDLGGPTSRIWQRYNIDAAISPATYIPLVIQSETESNFSQGGPSGWRIFGIFRQEYKDDRHKPHGTVKFQAIAAPHGGQKIIRVKAQFEGENHAFISSTLQQDNFGATIIPTLDISNDIFIRIERVKLYMDIVSLCYGDGFPNCESYIKDAAGTSLFLGTHVRIGYPPTHLYDVTNRLIWANAIRVQIDKNGNFGSEMWVFSQVLGAAPELRDEYPGTRIEEVFSKTDKKPRIVLTSTGHGHMVVMRKKFLWRFGNADEIGMKKPPSPLPLHLSAYEDLDKIRGLLETVWLQGPKSKITIGDWNNYHAHRDPNTGRTPDDPEYQVVDKSWKEKAV
jgi:hypothetical protein